MTHTYLLELGLEEVPARFLRSIEAQLVERVETFLSDHRLTYQHIQSFATPRRFAVLVEGLADKQTDQSEKLRGPSLKIAQADGEWTKAAQGFVKGQGLSTDDIVVEEVKGEPYIFVERFTKGKEAKDILPSIVSVLEHMQFPVSMTWNTLHTPYIRPVHWIVSLLDETVIPFEFLNIQAGRKTNGHRFLGKEVELNKATDYEAALKEQFVIADFNKRQQEIADQINQLAKDHQWVVPMDEELLEEVTAIVEWPTAFYGGFDEKYLQVPSPVLITAMKDHQRYFYVLNQQEELQPYFISVRNGNDYAIDNVVRGNQKVLRARLEDALFFYEDDLSHSIDYFVDKLSLVREHAKVGTYTEKQERVAFIIEQLANLTGEQTAADVAIRAAHIYKFDLMTQVVNEFDELQGVMGGIYAKEFGVDDDVALAISEQYLPNSEHQLPSTTASSLLAFSDKLDTVLQFFNQEMIPTGSSDPFALRRATLGMIEIALNEQWDFSFQELFQAVAAKESFNTELYASFANFVKARLQLLLSQKQIDNDIIQSDLKARRMNVLKTMKRAQSLMEYKKAHPEDYSHLVEALSRVVNLGAKVEEDSVIDASLSQSESEKQLIQLVLQLHSKRDSTSLLELFTPLVEPISRYFEENMVNHEDDVIRQNRLTTLGRLTQYILDEFDPRELISKF
ncbi:glycine--tRNA ligase subunit beta [Dolosicoccus paucivorans]|uniref:Glycine--tRNA ligase beta subunit n=1 Tax=Dolosicoccus paucivorans TaxID=84521 RepID=A0A2N6SN21_9LACT|nr:glycine--tRNA ligase subunit beta [Dolosicoccus paucivorans]PMB84332.1 glycine--tRNA ligase subunit beta [Dolosicoccus paucivorans]PMC58459.1 glycine--tRNA ligase subunit beta [Dolosicoccus paucivorans]